MLPKLCRQEGKIVLTGDNLSLHLSETVIRACSKNNIAFVCLYPKTTHLLQPLHVAWFAPLKKVCRKTLEDWKKSPQGLKHKGALPKENFNKLLKTLVSRLEENGASSENLVSGFLKCCLYPFHPDAVYQRLPSENVMSLRKSLDESLLQQLQSMRESLDIEKTPQNNKRTRLDVAPRKSVSNLNLDSSESESEESESRESQFGESSESESESDDNNESDDASAESSDADDEEVLTVSDINVGDFVLVKYKYSCLVKYYIGECMKKDSNEDISFIFLDRVCGSFFKYRENVIRETANISMMKNILAAPSVTRRRGNLYFKSSQDIIDRLKCLY